MGKHRLYFDMDGVLVDFQSGIDKLSEEVKKEYEGNLMCHTNPICGKKS